MRSRINEDYLSSNPCHKHFTEIMFPGASINISMDGVGQNRIRIVGHLQFAY